MKKKLSNLLLPLVLLFVISSKVHAQTTSKKPKGLIIGNSFTYRWDDEEGVSTRIVYQDFTWNLNVSTYISPNWRIGLASLQIFKKSEGRDWENFFMAGPMLQYDLWPGSKNIFIAETGVFYGDFAPIPGDLINRNNTFFGDIGLSCELSISKKWFLDIGFNYYPVLSRMMDKDNFVLYVIGVNYLLGER